MQVRRDPHLCAARSVEGHEDLVPVGRGWCAIEAVRPEISSAAARVRAGKEGCRFRAGARVRIARDLRGREPVFVSPRRPALRSLAALRSGEVNRPGRSSRRKSDAGCVVWRDIDPEVPAESFGQ
jgi:hypothetical protein